MLKGKSCNEVREHLDMTDRQQDVCGKQLKLGCKVHGERQDEAIGGAGDEGLCKNSTEEFGLYLRATGESLMEFK